MFYDCHSTKLNLYYFQIIFFLWQPFSQKLGSVLIEMEVSQQSSQVWQYEQNGLVKLSGRKVKQGMAKMRRRAQLGRISFALILSCAIINNTSLQEYQKLSLAMAEAENKKAAPHMHIVWELPRYNILELILISVRLLPAASIMCFVLLFQNYIRPRVMIPAIRRYLSCLVNLICLRIVLLLLGFFKFECENYQYFQKMPRMMTFRSGWVGVASHQTIIDFLYYSYLFNPVYARMIEFIDDQNKVKLFYTPLSFNEAFIASLSYRGFDPIVLRGEQQFKRFKRRKMLMPTLISECFEESNGPILLFLPSLGLNQQVSLHEIVGHDMFDNQRRFLRSGIAFDAQIEQNKNNARIRPEFANKIFFNQLILVTELCRELKVNTLTVIAIEMIKYKYEYTREIYSNFVNEMYQNCKITTLNLSFSDYLSIFNDKEKEELQKDERLNGKQSKNEKIDNEKQNEQAKEKESEQIKEEEMGLKSKNE